MSDNEKVEEELKDAQEYLEKVKDLSLDDELKLLSNELVCSNI